MAVAEKQLALLPRARQWIAKATSALEAQPARSTDAPLSFSDWMSYFSFSGVSYPVPIFGNAPLGEKQEVPQDSFEGYIRAIYKRNGPIFSVMAVRMLLFSEARFQFRERINGRPGKLYGSRELEVLEKPWQNATTGDMLSRMIQDADLAGNSFHALRAQRLYRMRPDWVTIVVGSHSKPQSAHPGWEIDGEVVGYIYQPGGHTAGEVEVLMPEEVAHFAPIPDPMFRFRGMSWIMPVLQDVLGDAAATTHKLKFFENGATPNMVVSLDKSVTDPKVFQEFVDKMEEEHAGVLNAYKTLYLAGGATTNVVGANMRQIDFKVTQGAGETRIASAAGVPPVIAGFSEGLQSATYANYSQARRRFADGTMRPLWRNAAGSLAPLIRVPKDAELWYDDRDIPFLKEDQKDTADILAQNAVAIRQLVDAGYEPESVVDAVLASDLSRLKHSGMYSVQLQSPGSIKMPDLKPGSTPDAPPKEGDAPKPVVAPVPAPPKRDDEPEDLDGLTPRERQIRDRLARSRSNKQIAEELGLTVKTVENHVNRLLRKLGIDSRTEVPVVVTVPVTIDNGRGRVRRDVIAKDTEGLGTSSIEYPVGDDNEPVKEKQ